MTCSRVLFLATAAALATLPAFAQPQSEPREKPSAWLGGGGLLVGIPIGEFGDATDEGFGAIGHVAFAPGAGPLGVRVQVGGLVYGSREVGTPVPGTGGLVTAPLTTDNWLLNVGIGPQLAVRSGPVRPYAYALAGLGYFATDTRFGDDYYGSPSSTNYDDTTFAWSAGAGLLFAVSRSVAIDVGVQYVGNGTVRYLAEGDLLPSPIDAPPVIVPRRTEANLVTVTVGVTFGR